MSFELVHNAYGKSHVRLTRVTRRDDRHDLQELTVDIQLEGDFAASYLTGDNSRVVATDSMKNTVYVLAGQQPFADLEAFGQVLAEHFVKEYAQVSSASVHLVQHPWQRMTFAGREHPYAFVGGSGEKRVCTVAVTAHSKRIEAGFTDLRVLKTTDSAFIGFIRDRYTTLAEASDRIFATAVNATWRYRTAPPSWDSSFQRIRETLLRVFAAHKSLAVQQTLHAMGSAALEECAEIDEITLQMPNLHRIPFNLQPFGLENRSDIFVPTDEPYGLITGTLRR